MRFFLVFALAATAMPAGDVLVQVGGIATAEGEIGCALFAAPKGFPMDSSGARVVWLRADRAGVICKFADVAPGQYAVSVAHDLNGNRKTDTKLFGIPVEPWGVSNNARPKMRAPRFAEAAFAVTAGGAALTVEVGK